MVLSPTRLLGKRLSAAASSSDNDNGAVPEFDEAALDTALGNLAIMEVDLREMLAKIDECRKALAPLIRPDEGRVPIDPATRADMTVQRRREILEAWQPEVDAILARRHPLPPRETYEHDETEPPAPVPGAVPVSPEELQALLAASTDDNEPAEGQPS